MTIEIKDNKFQILRYEGFGYVQNICNYDKNIFNLKISYQPNGLEGGNCKTIYDFEVIKKDNKNLTSIIEYIEDYSNYKNHSYYEYNSNQNNVIILNKKLDENKNTKKCIIL